MARPDNRTATTDRTSSAGRSADESRGANEKNSPTGGNLLSLATRLKVLVFWAGAVLMGLEISGSRVLAPHFGNSIFVWGSLITVFLAALSVGYFVGGWLADKHPSHVLLSTICIAVSLWIVALSFFAYAFCAGMVGSGFGEKTGPLFASLVLFLPPSIGMGVVSPFAIRLSASSITSLGKISGSLYALSTLGSIAGTMLTTFVLIPITGVSIILRGLGISLLLASLLILPTWKKAGSVAGIAGVILLLLVLLLAPLDTGLELGLGQHLKYEIGTPYHNIAVIDTPKYGVRELRFDRFSESGVYTTPPYPSIGYTNYFNLAFLLKPDIRHALFIGAGGGIGPRAFHMHQPEMQVDVVDIDPKVLEVARNYFFVEDTPQIKLIAEDGRMFVKNSKDQYDCILLDAFTIGGRIPFHLVTKEFFTLCRERLTDDGVFVMNTNSALVGPLADIFRSVDRTLEEVFPGHVYVFAANDGGRIDRRESMNIVFVATKSGTRLTPREWHAKFAEYKSASYVDPFRMQQLVGDLVVEMPDVSAAPVFTDDYAPIETMAF